MTAEEKDELLARLLAGEKPELTIGRPEHMTGDGLWLAVPKPDGGVAVLVGMYLEDQKSE
jgi:hypothetical protein